MVPRRAAAELVGREVLASRQQAEAIGGHDQVEIALARADRAVAFDHAREIARHLEAHAPAVTSAGVGPHSRAMLVNAFGRRQPGSC